MVTPVLDMQPGVSTSGQNPAARPEDAGCRVQSVCQLEELLAALECPSSRPEACARLHALARELHDRGASRPEAGSLALKVIETPSGGTLKLLLHPAVFPPEDWSRTFAEGLLKSPELYTGKRLVEIGVGCGWISLLLLCATEVLEVVGLDINPVAVLMARLNSWLNGTDEHGDFKMTRLGRPLPLAFSACVSDLLSEPLLKGERFDHVIGCIPQVLHPDPQALARLEQSPSEKDLYDLSNYCFQQGIVEDRYGLPLVARALLQSHQCLAPGGSVTFMLGGRPGREPVEQMFRRRGFTPELIWSRRVKQANDTDIASLVSLENHCRISFKFFVSALSTEPVPARTISRILAAGRPVFHDVFVYRGHAGNSTNGELLANLGSLGLADAYPDLDLSLMCERHAGFVTALTRELSSPPQTSTVAAGSRQSYLRRLIAAFLRVYCEYDARPEELVIGSQSKLIPALLSAVAGRGKIVLVSHSLLDAYQRLLAGAGLDIAVCNNDLSDILELDEALAPAACIISPWQLKDSSAPLTARLLAQQAGQNPQRLYIVDDSQHFQSGCEHQGNLMLKLLRSEQSLARNIALLYHHSSPPFGLTALLNLPASIGANLAEMAPDAGSQLYYEWLFRELLRFTVKVSESREALEPTLPLPRETALGVVERLLRDCRVDFAP